jgi:hypothetical protein
MSYEYMLCLGVFYTIENVKTKHEKKKKMSIRL